MFKSLYHFLVSYLILYLIEALNYSENVSGNYLSMTLLASVIARVLWGAVSDYIFKGRRKITLGIIGFIATIGFFAITFVSIETSGILTAIIFIVIGAKNSSNSLRLVEVAKKSGCINSKLISFNEKLPIESIIKCEKIGITSGASAPEQLVQDLISEIKKHCKVSMEEIVLTKEKVTFKLPKHLN